jgi:hypothetical protein
VKNEKITQRVLLDAYGDRSVQKVLRGARAMIDFDNRQMIRLEKQIAELSDNAIPIAIQQTLNNTARNAWLEGRNNTDREFNNRNTWTKRTQTYQQTRELNVNKMVSITGSSADYLAQQEEGFTRQSKGDGVWVPTAEAAGETGQTRSKPIRAKFRRSRIKVKRGRAKKPVSRAQAQLFKIINAVNSRSGHFWGTLNNTKGMWQLEGSTDSGRIVLSGVRLLYSARKRTIRTPKHEWHLPAVEKANERLGVEYYRALKRQMARLKRKYKL